MKFTPFPELKTERLILRRIEITDGDGILFLRSDPSVTKYIERPENRKTKTLDAAVQFIKEIHGYLETETSVMWAINLKDNPTLIGTICLWNFSEDQKTAEVGYDLYPNFQKQGIMNQALQAIILYGFEKLRLEGIEAFTNKENESSIQLLNKNGFQLKTGRKDKNNVMNLIFELKNHHSK